MKKKATQEELLRLQRQVEALADQLKEIGVLVGLRLLHVPEQPSHVKWVRADSPEWTAYEAQLRAAWGPWVSKP